MGLALEINHPGVECMKKSVPYLPLHSPPPNLVSPVMANGFSLAYVANVLAMAQQHLSAPSWRATTGQAVYELTQMQRELGG